MSSHVPPVTPPAMKFRITPFGRVLLYAAPVLLVGLVVACGVAAVGLLSHDTASPYGNSNENRYDTLYHLAAEPPKPDGERLYVEHCSRCHGVNGDGNGSTPLSPKARAFGRERFKFTDTLNGQKQPQGAAGTLGGIPTDDRLVALLKRGIEGSPMPSFASLADVELQAIVDHLRTRFVTPDALLSARMDLELAKAKQDEDFDPKKDWPPKADKLKKWWDEAVADVGLSEPLAIPFPFPPARAGYQQRAAALFEKLGCLGCHGKTGEGTFDAKRKNDNGTMAYPRNLTAGIYKGGGEPEHLFRRVYLGIPGTPMKAFGKEATADEIVDLVYYVKDFAKPTTSAGKP